MVWWFHVVSNIFHIPVEKKYEKMISGIFHTIFQTCFVSWHDDCIDPSGPSVFVAPELKGQHLMKENRERLEDWSGRVDGGWNDREVIKKITA
jgi:hypothetical protein